MRAFFQILGLCLVSFPVASASAAAPRGHHVVGANVVERSGGGAAWAPLAGGRMHPGWQLSCPTGCVVELPGARARLDENTILHDVDAPLPTEVGESASFEILEGGVTGEVFAEKAPLLLQTATGAQLAIVAAGTGRAVVRSGREQLAAMEGNARARIPGSSWTGLAAGTVMPVTAGKLGQPRPLLAAPKWANVPAGSTAALADARGNVGAGAAWSGDATAVAYQVEIARDAGFRRPLVSSTTEYSSLRGETVPVGTYYVRVRAIDIGGLESAVSAVRVLKIVAALPDA